MGRYFITGGGTGGHIYPAIAVANALLNDEIFYVGNPKNLEFDVVKKNGYKFLPICVSSMPRSLSLKFIKFLWQLFVSVVLCCFYIIKYKPDAVFGTGGYVSAPPLIAAQLLGIPYMMHDSDAQPGIVSRKLAGGAKCISVAFESACKFLNNKNCFVNGNPIRIEFSVLTKSTARKNLELDDKLTICIMGGSQGARTINNATVGMLKNLFDKYDVQVIFQTGKKNYDVVQEQLTRLYPDYELNKRLIVRPYFDDMVSVLKASDIAVSRSGSLSIFEICASSVAPIYVPYPYAAADHQRKNAKYMVEKGAGLYIEDSEITPDTLFNMLAELINDSEKLINIQEASLSCAHFDGTEQIVKRLKML